MWYKLWRCIIANILYRLSDAETKSNIDADINRYLADSHGHKKNVSLNYLLLSPDKTFRNVFYYRVGRKKTLCSISKLFLPDIKGIELYGTIGGGLRLSHNCMVVHPEKAGKNLCVEAGVVIGKNNGQYPIIGDNVHVAANATVIGGITIGDNVIIEAGSVVTKNLEGNGIYGGNPAHFVQAID